MPQIPVGEPAEDGDFKLIPEGEVVAASVADFQEVPSKYTDDDGNPKNQFQWDFIVTEDGPFMGTKIRSWTTTNFVAHPNCKAYVWSKAVLRRDFSAGQVFDTDDLIGKPCKLVIGHSDDGKWHRIQNVLPARNAQPSAISTSDSPQEAPF